MKSALRKVKTIPILPSSTMLTALFVLLVCGPAFGDMGAIHISAHEVIVSEPAQKAIILHNGFEEVLMLETDIKATKKTGILRFLPLPSEPTVELAPETAFGKVSELVRSKSLKIISVFHSKGGEPASQSAPVVEAISHKKLGAHDLTVIKINDAGHFNEWVQSYFMRNQLGALANSALIDEMVQDYVKRGISYFAFDFVKVDATDTSIAPLAYRFKTRKVYYPLKTSNSVGGEGKVQLFLLAPNAVGSPMLSAHANSWPLIDPSKPAGFDRFQLSTYEAVTPEEVSGVYPDIREFFADMPIVLQCASYSGQLSFAEDLHLLMLEHFNPMQEQASGGEPTGVEPEENASLESLLQEGTAPWHRRNSALDKAEKDEFERRSLTASVLKGSIFLSSTERVVKLKDGRWEEGDTRVELRMLAIGDLKGDHLPDAAVLFEVSKNGESTCELSVLEGKNHGGVLMAQEPQKGLTIGVGPRDIRTMSVTNRMIHLKPKSTAPIDYAIRGDKLECIKE